MKFLHYNANSSILAQVVLAVVDVDFTMVTLEAFVARAAEFKSFSLVCRLKALTYKNRRVSGTFRSCTDSALCYSTPAFPHRTCRRTFWGTRSGSYSPRIGLIETPYVWSFTISTHFPPFRHLWFSQSSMLTSQWWPLKPLLQTHLKRPSWIT